LEFSISSRLVVKKCHRDSVALLNLENIAVLAISKEVVQGIGHGSPQVIIRLVFAQIISKITGSEVTPFAVITDESTGVKYPLADYKLLPKMAIVDADMMMNAPRGLTAASGIDAVPHALEAYASIMATDYTDGLALRSLKLIFENLPAAYEQGAKAPRARENMANAATMAGYGLRQCLPGRMPLHGPQAGRFPPSAPRHCKCPADPPGPPLQCRQSFRENGHLLPV
jgi:hypothetical protein